MKISVSCKKCQHVNTVGFTNFKEKDMASVNGKAFAFNCKGCGETLKFKIQSNGQNKG